jgi:hypothetical protein
MNWITQYTYYYQQTSRRQFFRAPDISPFPFHGARHCGLGCRQIYPVRRPARAGSPPWVSPSRREPRHVPHGHHAPVQHGGLRKPLLTHGHLLPSLPSTDSLPTPSLDERRRPRRQQMGGGGSSGRYMELTPEVDQAN